MADLPATNVLSRSAQKRWALFGCLGCGGFLALALVLSLLGMRNALQPDNVWSQLHAYLGFEDPPEGYAPLFEVAFFDQRQISFYREADHALVVVQEFTSRVREDFDDALDPEKLSADGLIVEHATIELQGRAVELNTVLGDTSTSAGDVERLHDSLPGRLLGKLGLVPDDLPTFPTDTPVHQIRFSGANDGGGTLLVVRAPTSAPMTAQELEELFAPFDLWAFVDSAPAAPPMPASE